MDDNFRFKFKPLAEITTITNDIFIFDVAYKRVYCGLNSTRRKLLSSNENKTHYAMAVWKLNPVL